MKLKLRLKYKTIAYPRLAATGIAIVAGAFGTLCVLVLLESAFFAVPGAFIAGYSVFSVIVILAHSAYLSEVKFIAFSQEYSGERIAGTVHRKRMRLTTDTLREHFRREKEPSEAGVIVDVLLSAFDFAIGKVLMIALFLVIAALYIPYAYISDAPERFLAALAYGSQPQNRGYVHYFTSIFLLGLIFLGISVLSWGVFIHAVFFET